MRRRTPVLATLETKAEEVGFLKAALERHGLAPELVDVSLRAHGQVWNGACKLRAIEDTSARAADALSRRLDGEVAAIVGLGGGTGGEIVLRVMQALPAEAPKLLITTLPFDPRAALAQNAITLVPTLVDIAGLNPTLRRVFAETAAMVAGLARAPAAPAPGLSVGVTALGATEGCAEALVAGLKARGEEATLFHANGYGGAAFARFAGAGAFNAIIDMTVHELTRLLFAGAHAPMPTRFSAGADLPRVVLPGGLNFLGLGPPETLTPEQAARPHYRHTAQFTHVTLTEPEMDAAARALAAHLNALSGPVEAIIPMGGFSHRDCPGGEIEDARLRAICLDALRAEARGFAVTAIPHHINAPQTAHRVLDALQPHLERRRHA